MAYWRRLALFLLLLGSTTASRGAAQEPQPAEAPILIDCTECEAGVATVDCLYCEGHGKTPCIRCRGWSPPRGNAIDQLTQSVLDRMPDSKLSADAVRGKKADAIRVACPARCSMLQSVYPWLKDDCPICDGKGSFRCSDCKQGASSCVPCAGKGEVLGTCRRCLGKGRLAYLEDGLATDTCPWCKDEGMLVCTKHFEPPREISCGTCKQRGKISCPDCAGSKRTLCQRCTGSGKFRDARAGTAVKCDKCPSQRGYLNCVTCERKGSVQCPTCQGEKKLARGCGSCRERFFDCAGCRLEQAGQSQIVLSLFTKKEVPEGALLPCVRAWTETAAQLEAEGRHAQSLRWLQAAHDQAVQRIERGLRRGELGEQSELPEEMVRPLEGQLPQLASTLQAHLMTQISRVKSLIKDG